MIHPPQHIVELIQESDQFLHIGNFAGKCAEALRFHEQHLNGQIGMMMTHGQAPDQSNVKPEGTDGVHDARLHARDGLQESELIVLPGGRRWRNE